LHFLTHDATVGVYDFSKKELPFAKASDGELKKKPHPSLKLRMARKTDVQPCFRIRLDLAVELL
jgi:hypothetical protein